MLTIRIDCPADPAVGGTVSIDFTKGENDFFTVADGTKLSYDPSLGAVFSISNENEAPTISSTKYIFFGKVDVTVRASVGQGVVTSFVLQSDDLDEIDWEWLGGDEYNVQTNYFSKGDTTTYDRGGISPVGSPQDTFHTYTIDWTAERLNWIIDGTVVRTLTYADAKGGATYPQTPMQIKLGTWVAGKKDAPKGTVEWAGGYTNFADAPFLGYYKSVVITDYSNGVEGAKEYSYGDRSGTYESIKISTTGGDVSGGKSSSSSSAVKPTSTSASAKASSTKHSSTFSTVTSSAVSSSGTASADATDSTASATETAASTSGSSTTAAETSSTPSTTAAPANAGVKSGVNVALLGAALFAFFAL